VISSTRSAVLGAFGASRPDKTLLDVLFPRIGWRSGRMRLRGVLHRKIRVGKLHAKLPVLARDAVRSELTGLIAQVLATRLSEVAAAGWRRSSRVQDAVSRTRANPAATEIVMIGEHTITFTDLPCIVTRIDSVPGPRLEVALVVELHVGGIAATIREGRLVELRSEASDVTVALGIAGERIARRFTSINLDDVVRDGAGGVGLHLSNAATPSVADVSRPALAEQPGPPSDPSPELPPARAIDAESVQLDVR
jgi:hypothetical protein